MILQDTTVSIEVELDPEEHNEIDGTLEATGDTGPNRMPMYRIKAKVPVMMRWLSDVLGWVNEDILLDLPNWKIEDLIP